MTLHLRDCLLTDDLYCDHLGDESEDLGQPYLMVDMYPLDRDDPSTPEVEDLPWAETFEANPHLIAACVKLHDGAGYAQKYTDWGIRQLQTLFALFKERRGITRFAGGYLFVQYLRDWLKQGEAFLYALESAGWGELDIVPILDAEEGIENDRASAQQVIDCVSSIAEWLTHRTGRQVMLYGRGTMREKSIASKMGCSRVWNPSYTAHMHLDGLVGELPDGKQAAWTLNEIPWWQAIGDGDGDSSVTHLLKRLAVLGAVDISVAINGATAPTMETARRSLL